MKKVYLIDAFSLIFRSYYAFKDKPLRNKAGENTNAFVGFFRTIFSLIKNEQPSYFALIFDSPGGSQREEIYSAYKATRHEPPPDLIRQIPWILQTVKALGIPSLAQEGYEADDLLASLARQASQEGFEVLILSPDKDLLQTINTQVKIIKLEKNGLLYIDESRLWEDKHLRPDQITDYLALIGDQVDNIPGVRGVGEKTARALLKEWDNLENIYQHLHDIKPSSLQNKLKIAQEDAFLSYQLVKLEDQLQLVSSAEDLSLPPLGLEACTFFEEHDAKVLIRDLYSLRQDKDKLPEESSLPKKQSSRGLYHVITTDHALKELLQKALDAPMIALDTETTGLNVFRDRLLGISLAFEEGHAYYIPLEAAGVSYLSLDLLRSEFNRFFSSPGVRLVGHNLKFDYQILIKEGFILPHPYFDTMLAAYLLDSSSRYKLDFLADQILDHQCISYQEVTQDFNGEFKNVPLEAALEYAAEDAEISWRLVQELRPRLDENNMNELFFSLEMPVMEVLTSMELEGIYLDFEHLKKLSIRLDDEIQKVRVRIYQLSEEKFNINSSQQIQRILFEKMQLKTGKKNKQGYSTNARILEELALEHELPREILEYRKLTKLKNTYVDTLPELIEPGTGRIHSSFIQTGASTGRISSQYPNLQNIPIKDSLGREIRQAFVAKPGYVFISADYIQIELLVLAELCGDPHLHQDFQEGHDIHSQTASTLFGIPLEKVDSQQRRIAKSINFGIIYQMSAFRLASELGISRSEASQFIEAYFAHYAKIKPFIEEQLHFVRTHGYSQTILGRRRNLPHIHSPNMIERQAAERMSVNSVIQGSAADIVKKAMIKTQDIPQTNLLLQVHDELLFECPQDLLETNKKLIKERMEGALKLSLPLRVQMRTGPTWGQLE